MEISVTFFLLFRTFSAIKISISKDKHNSENEYIYTFLMNIYIYNENEYVSIYLSIGQITSVHETKRNTMEN